MARNLRLFKPYVSWSAVWNTVKVLRSGQLAEGPQVKAFEQEFGERFGFEHVVALNSGTAALELAYELLNIKPGDEVIAPVLSHPATSLGVVRHGGTVVFADIEDDLNVSVADVVRRITPKTKAIVFVHFGGNNRGLKELLEIAKQKNIPLVEDAAQAVGSAYWGKGDLVCVSLQAIKMVTSGDGGFLVCKRVEDAEKAKRLRWFGYDRAAKQKYGDTDITEAGYKYHMNDIAAAIGRANLRSLDSVLAHRARAAEAYRTAELPIVVSTWLAVLVHPKALEVRDALKSQGIESGQHHYRNDKYTIFGGLRQDLPNMDRLQDGYLLLPYHHDITPTDVRRIATVIESVLSSRTPK